MSYFCSKKKLHYRIITADESPALSSVLWNVGAIQGVRGTGRERIDKGTREKGVFSFHRTFSPPRDKASNHHEMYFPEHSPSPRGKDHTIRKKKIPFPMLSVAGKEDHPSNSYLLESPSNRVIFYSKIVYRRMSIFANVAYMWERIASRVWKSWENGPQSRNKCLRRTWLHVHVYRRNGREHAKTGVVVTELIPMLPGLTWKLVLT